MPVAKRPRLAAPRFPIDARSRKLSSSIFPMAAISPKVFMSTASITDSMRSW
ncbi:MAG: hypothetical protein OXK21_00690 [Chloroflexota bacterium]|nr:hypothetical protein [Chloroflexota bacterium]